MTDLTLQMRIKAEAAKARREVAAMSGETRRLGEATKGVGTAGKTAGAQIKQAAVEQGAAVKAAGIKASEAIKRLKQDATAAGDAIKHGMRDGARETRRTGDETSRLGQRVQAMLRRVGDAGGVFRIMGRTASSEIGRIKHAMSGLGGRLGALGLGVGIGAQIKNTAVRERDYIRMQQTAELSPIQRDAVRATNWQLASKYGVDEASLRGGTNTLLAKGLKLSAVNATMDSIARASAVTGAAPAVLAEVGATAANNFGIDMNDPKAVARMFDQMVVATRAGGMEMEDLAATIPTVSKQAKALDLDFPRALAFMETMSSVVPDKARAATAVESGLRIFSNDTYRQQVANASGIPHLFFDEKGKRRAPEYALEKLGAVYGQLPTDAARAAWIGKVSNGMDNDTKAWLTSMLDPKLQALFKDILVQQHGAQAVVGGSLGENLDSATGVAGRLKGTFGAAFDRMAAPINKVLADAGSKLLDTGMSGEQMLGVGAAAAGGAYITQRLGGTLARKLAGMVGGGMDTVKNLAVGKALQDATGVMPVFVTNWSGAPAGGGVGTAAAVETAVLGKEASKVTKASRVAGAMRTVGEVAVGAAVIATVHEALAPARAAEAAYFKQNALDHEMAATGLSADQVDRRRALGHDMPYGQWINLPENKGKYGLLHAGFDDYDRWLNQQARLAPPAMTATDPAQLQQQSMEQMQQAAAVLDAARRGLEALIGRPLQIEVTSDTPELHAKLNQRHERDARRG